MLTGGLIASASVGSFVAAEAAPRSCGSELRPLKLLVVYFCISLYDSGLRPSK